MPRVTERDAPTALDRLDQYEPLPRGDAQYSLDFCEENRVLKLRESGDLVEVAVAVNPSLDLAAVLEQYHGRQVRFFLVNAPVFQAALGRVFSLGELDPAGTSQAVADTGYHLDTLEGDAPVVNFINTVLIDAIRLGASDVHLECFTGYGLVRLRVDGSLVEAGRFAAERFPALAARIKIMANLNIMEKRLPQDGRISVDVGEERVDLRVSIVPIARGESIVLRLLGRRNQPLSLSELGMDEAAVSAVQRMLAYPHGLVLVTGPTGSGKTTSLNAMLRRIQSTALKIITIEDPVEYVLDGLDQIQVNEQIGLGFDTLLRRVLRQDPNVIMVGEVRDAATAELVIRAALTGHLVLSTLHTNDSVAAVSRLRNIGVEPFLIAAVLRGVLAQRLVRRLCPHCRKPDLPHPAEVALAARHGLSLERLARAGGCPECHHTGFLGRFALYEYFLPDERLEELIVQSTSPSELYDYLGSKGMQSLARAGLERVAAGETTIAELEREVEL